MINELETVEHSNEFSIKSEDNDIKSKSKVKFQEESIKNNENNENNKDNNKTLYNYLDMLKINFTNIYGTTNIVTTFLTILFMVIKILYKNLSNK